MKGECPRLAALGLAALVGSVVLLCAPRAALAQTAPSLRAAQGFAVLAGSTVTNTGPTVLTGSLGVSPGSAITGFPPGLVLGTTHRADAAALAAQKSAAAAYDALAAQTCTRPFHGGTLTAGIYCSSGDALFFTTTLDAQGDPNAVFIFQFGGDLSTASCGIPRPCTEIRLINGASPCNVFWQVAGSVRLGGGTSFAGNTLALTNVTLEPTAFPTTVVGRLLARNGAVTLDSSTASAPCATASPGCPTITLTPSTLPNGTVGIPYRQTLAGSGGTAPVSVSVVSGGLGELTITLAGLISGTPLFPATRTYTCTLRGTDAAGCFNDYPYSLTITQAVPTLPEGFVLVLAASLAGVGYLRLRQNHEVTKPRGSLRFLMIIRVLRVFVTSWLRDACSCY
jgi:hypothetical protein